MRSKLVISFDVQPIAEQRVRLLVATSTRCVMKQFDYRGEIVQAVHRCGRWYRREEVAETFVRAPAFGRAESMISISSNNRVEIELLCLRIVEYQPARYQISQVHLQIRDRLDGAQCTARISFRQRL